MTRLLWCTFGGCLRPVAAWDRRLGYVCDEHRPLRLPPRAAGAAARARGNPRIPPAYYEREPDATEWRIGYDEQAGRIGG